MYSFEGSVKGCITTTKNSMDHHYGIYIPLGVTYEFGNLVYIS